MAYHSETTAEAGRLRFGDLTYEEVAAQANQGAIALLPTGCTEQQGPHLPVDWDTWFAERACLAAAERANEKHGLTCVVLPATPFGPTPEHRDFGSGYIDVPYDIHRALIASALDSLADQGFRRIVVWKGCGGHRLEAVIDAFNGRSASRGARAWLPAPPYHEIWKRHGDWNDSGGHADSFTTAIALYLRPESVREDRIVESDSLPVDWDDPDLSFAKYSRTGVIGTPIYGTRELGRVLWNELVDWAADMIQGVSRG